MKRPFILKLVNFTQPSLFQELNRLWRNVWETMTERFLFML